MRRWVRSHDRDVVEDRDGMFPPFTGRALAYLGLTRATDRQLTQLALQALRWEHDVLAPVRADIRGGVSNVACYDSGPCVIDGKP